MLLIFEWISHSSSVSLEEIKLLAIVNGIFHASYFLRLLLFMSFKYGLISSRHSLIDKVLWGLLWKLFVYFFLLKTVSNIFNYSLLDCFNYFIFWLFFFIFDVPGLLWFSVAFVLKRFIILSLTPPTVFLWAQEYR